MSVANQTRCYVTDVARKATYKNSAEKGRSLKKGERERAESVEEPTIRHQSVMQAKIIATGQEAEAVTGGRAAEEADNRKIIIQRGENMKRIAREANIRAVREEVDRVKGMVRGEAVGIIPTKLCIIQAAVAAAAAAARGIKCTLREQQQVPVLSSPASDSKHEQKEQKQARASRVQNRIRQLNLRHGPGASQVAVQCNIGGKDVLAVVDTGAEVSLIRRSIVKELNIKMKDADYDLISLSNIAMETHGVINTRVRFNEGKNEFNAQGLISVVPDAIFEPSIGALLGMDVLTSVGARIDVMKEELLLRKSGKEMYKRLVTTRGIRSRDNAMAAVVTSVYRGIGEKEAHTMVQDILSRDTTLLELPLIDVGIVNVNLSINIGKFPKMTGEEP